MKATTPIKTRSMQVKEREDPQGRDIRDILRDAYARGGGIVEAARLMDVAPATFQQWVAALGGTIRREVDFSGREVAA